MKMKLSEIFIKFKNVTPDPLFTEKSKRAVLASPQNVPGVRERGVMVFLRALETGAALVLAGFFIMLATGSFSGSPISPVQYAVIDPNGLHAEAQAIDIQIQLANLDYSVPASSSGSTTTAVPAAAVAAFRAAGVGSATSSAASSTTSNAATSTDVSTSSLSVNQALEALSQ